MSKQIRKTRKELMTEIRHLKGIVAMYQDHNRELIQEAAWLVDQINANLKDVRKYVGRICGEKKDITHKRHIGRSLRGWINRNRE